MIYTGAIKAPEDKRDLSYKDYAVATGKVEFDWEKGFDIRRDVLHGDFKYKNQNTSLSCVAQAWSYYMWVLNIVELMKTNEMTYEQLNNYLPQEVAEVSAKAIYSQIKLPKGGAYIYKGGRLATKWGGLFETEVKSHLSSGRTNEKFMSDLSWKTPEMDRKAELLQGKDLRAVRDLDSPDLFAKAIQENYGLVGGVYGANNGTWNTEFPKPPKSKNKIAWGHGLVFLAAGLHKGRKFIATPNSWGNILGYRGWKEGDPVGAGMQKLYIDEYMNHDYMFDPWTYTDKPNKALQQADIKKIYQGKLIGNEGKPAYYFVNGDDIIHIKDEGAFYLGRDQKWWGDWGDRINIKQIIKKTKTLSVK